MNVTYVSRLTGVGRSAIAVVAVCGPQSRELIAASFHAATDTPWCPGQIRYGTWHEYTDGESVVLTPISENHFEIHGHGGVAAVSRIITSLRRHGAVEVPSSAFRQFAASNSGEIHEPLLAEAEQVLTQCTTQRNAAIALAQYRGALLDWTIQWADRCIEQLRAGSSDAQRMTLGELSASAAELYGRQSIGRHLVAPYRVVLAGPPNVGKSSLVNRIVGYARSITHDQAGTTRDVVDCDTVIAGLAIRLGDTAGIRAGGGVIEREGIRRGAMAIASSDLVVLVVDPESFAEHASLLATIGSLHRTVDVVQVLNKSDQLVAESPLLTGDSQWLTTIALEVGGDADALGCGINALMETIARRLRPESLPPSAPVPITPRQSGWIATIRDADDLPHAAEALHGLRSGSDAIEV